jgi:hypothetical protein
MVLGQALGLPPGYGLGTMSYQLHAESNDISYPALSHPKRQRRPPRALGVAGACGSRRLAGCAMTTAFVLGGGGPFGAQVGMLRALAAAGLGLNVNVGPAET